MPNAVTVQILIAIDGHGCWHALGSNNYPGTDNLEDVLGEVHDSVAVRVYTVTVEVPIPNDAENLPMKDLAPVEHDAFINAVKKMYNGQAARLVKLSDITNPEKG